MILNLDKNFKPFGENNALVYESFVFPGGEPHIRIVSDLSLIDKVLITIRACNFQDMGLLLVAVDALRRSNVVDIELFIPYLPGARQDRIIVNGEPLTSSVYACLINSMSFSKVTIFDPHSDVAPALIDRCNIIDNRSFAKLVMSEIGSIPLLVAPDAGSIKKVNKIVTDVESRNPIYCLKKRDLKTGKLNGFQVIADNLEGKDCLIIDDICDGGGTFIGIAKELKKKNAGKLFLAVSHGIFSKGFDVLFEHYEKVFCTNSFADFSNESKRLVQIELSNILK